VAEYAVDFGLSDQVPALVYAAWQDGALTPVKSMGDQHPALPG
jgi:hypothetical protein